MTLSFFVPGKPAPGGSKRAFIPRRKDGSLVTRPGTNYPMVNMTDAGGKANKIWRERVTLIAKSKMLRQPPHRGGCVVTFTFFMPRPADHYGTGKNASLLKSGAPARHLQAPDVLKLSRSTEDAMTKVLWHDDCQTIDMHVYKRWAEPGKDGCLIEVEFLPDAQMDLLSGGVENAHTPANRLIPGADLGSEKPEPSTKPRSGSSAPPAQNFPREELGLPGL